MFKLLKRNYHDKQNNINIMASRKIKMFSLYRLLLVLFITVIAFCAAAQKRTMIYGYLLDSIKYSPIKNGTVLNTNSNKSVTTNEKGMFSIPVAINDVLYFTADSYHFNTVRYKMMMRDTIVVYMNLLAHVLPGVTVRTQGYTKYQLDS